MKVALNMLQVNLKPFVDSNYLDLIDSKVKQNTFINIEYFCLTLFLAVDIHKRLFSVTELQTLFQLRLFKNAVF